MHSRRILMAGVAAVFTLAGCQNTPEKQSTQTPQPSSDALLADQAAPHPADPTPSADPAMDDITLLAQKAEAHARRIAADLERHPQPPAPTAAPASPTDALPPAEQSRRVEVVDPEIPDPAITEWLDPQILSLNPAAFPTGKAAQPTARSVSATQRPTSQSAPPANAPPEGAAPERGSANKPVVIANEELIASNTDSGTAEQPASHHSSPPASADVSADASSLHRALAQRIADDPHDTVAHLEYQLLRYIEGKQVPDLGTLASLPREDQEIVTAVLDSLSNFRNSLRADSNLLLSRKVKPLMDLGDRLRAQADLEIPTLLLARRVDGFGVYEPIEHRFVAGRDRDVIVYCEVANFMSQLTEQQQWETRLTEEVVLYTDADGLPILRDKPTIVPDLSRNRRHDFFIVRRLRLPGNIPVGRYWLKVTVVDQLASRVAEASIPITFVAN